MNWFEFLIELFTIGTPYFVVLNIVCYIGYYLLHHLPDCKEYPNMYTKELW